ncbi:MAG: chromosome segregation SMC family protein [archaeon]
MPYVKKLVMKGFKSFASETELPFTNSMNVIVGPNGSGKSNIADAICFVLGRLSIKSMRAAKAANLIFNGTKTHKPSQEASVKIIFDNSDKKFSLAEQEVSVERRVKTNGQSVYKINNVIKTRQEVLELLGQAGIDPYGFNIVLQGEIMDLVKMNSEERRKILEEVAGISVYESRKEKSLRELGKTEEKLKEISAILRERTAYLRNLEEERKQALKFKQLEENIQSYKASILARKIGDKKKDLSRIESEIDKKQTQKDKIKAHIQETQKLIQTYEEKVEQINSSIQKSTGLEQETLHNQVTELREELAGLTVRKENMESRISEILERREALSEDIKHFEKEISELKKKGLQAKKQEDLESKRRELDQAELDRKKFYSLSAKLDSIKIRILDREKQIQKSKNESDFTLQEIESLELQTKEKTPDSCREKLKKLNAELISLSANLSSNHQTKTELEKLISVCESEILNLEKIKKQVGKIDICPLCKSKITQEHIKHVFDDSEAKIKENKKQLSESLDNLKSLTSSIEELSGKIDLIKQEIADKNIELVKLGNINSRKQHLAKLLNEEKILHKDISELSKEKDFLEKDYHKNKNIEERYDRLLIEVEEISSRSEKNIDAELEFKIRDLEKIKLIVKQTFRDESELESEVKSLSSEIEQNEKALVKKDAQEKQLQERFKKLFQERTDLQKNIHEENSKLLEVQHKLSVSDESINNDKIGRAKVSAEIETLEVDLEPFRQVKILPLALSQLQEKLEKAEHSVQVIGSVNLRALEVYDEIKKEYDSVAEKVARLNTEKEEILKIIQEIDTKKKKSFLKTLNSVNELFTRNFLQLSTKGEAFLNLENKDEPFSAGLDILIKLGKGKYFDVTSLSGGEKTLVALSLIFAIQEFKPYSFYIFDEVDAALDKRNSERLASLIKKFMKTGQYIIVTHNDILITESNILYGISMQDGISKILSLEV